MNYKHDDTAQLYDPDPKMAACESEIKSYRHTPWCRVVSSVQSSTLYLTDKLSVL